MKKRCMAWILVLSMLLGLLLPAGPAAVTQKAAQQKKVKLSFRKIALEPKESFKLKVSGAKGKVRWTSTKKKVAVVTAKGKVTAKKKGKAVIRAKAGKKTYACKVTVAPRKLNRKSAVLEEGESLRLKLSNSFGTMKWTSSNSRVASVSRSGLVTAKGAGTARITVICNRKKYRCAVTVQKKDAPGITPGITITFTNSGIENLTAVGGQTAYQSLAVRGTSVAVTGKAECRRISLKKLSCELRDSADNVRMKRDLAAETDWRAELNPAVGTNTFTVTAVGSDGTTVEKSLTIVRYSDQVTVSDKVVSLDEEKTKDFAEAIEEIDYETKEEEVNGNTVSHNYIEVTVDAGSSLAADLKNGTVKEGDILSAAEQEVLPAGFTGVVVKYERKTDTTGEKMVITFREPDFSDVFTGEGCLEVSGIDETDPIAFVITPESADKARSGGSTARAETGSYSRSVFPEGLAVSMGAKASFSGNAVSLGMDFKDIVLYDKDKDKATKDQIVLNGSVGLKDMTAESNLEWGRLLPSQIRYDENYTQTANLKISSTFQTDALDFSDIIEEANGEFKNECELMGMKVRGIDMSDRFLIGLVGIHMKTKVDIVGMGEIGDYAKKVESPIMIVALYLDVSGKIKGELSVSLDSSTYTEQGINLYNGSFNNVKYSGSGKRGETKDLGGGYKLETYSNKRKSKNDYGTPGPVVTLEGKAEAGVEAAVGAMAGVMFMGIIPADCYLEAYSSTEADLDGKLEIKTGVTDEGLHRLNPSLRIRASQETGARVGFDVKLSFNSIAKYLKGVELGGSGREEFKWINETFDFPKYKMHGTVSKFKTAASKETEPVPGARFRFYQKDKLEKIEGEYTEEFLTACEPDAEGKSEAGGVYSIRGMGREEYVLLVTKDGCVPFITTMSFNADKEQMLCLEPIREVNWLDVCRPWKYEGYGGGGETYIGDGKGSMQISGVTYDVGFYLDGGDAGKGSSYSYWNLQKKYSALKVRIGHLDTSSVLTATLKIFLDGEEEPSQVIPMDPKASSKVYTLNLNYANTAVIKMERGSVSNWAHAQYGFTEGIWYGTEGAQGTVNAKDPFENADWNADFMTLCPPFLIKSGEVNTAEDGTSLNVTGLAYDSGFSMNTNGPGFAVFRTDGQFSALKVTVGLMTDSSRDYKTKLFVYLNGSAEPDQTIELNPAVMSELTIPLRRAQGVRLELEKHSDSMNGAGASYGFVNGKWIR